MFTGASWLVPVNITSVLFLRVTLPSWFASICFTRSAICALVIG